ncbi:progranulin [Procambarus clarkii]|uniref:progranulin n=1 Tax=Procambarus clarkii TaxID=6728 RepID=UPI001E6776FC|nr:progranulin-like isoform X1 [Procambarus clarkii]XP_045615309.1 progranulin-like isoform X1 [Procambarus clarkii]XP_045615310.1 progranulin-like isoform X1 [Procambarus clarkii]
MMVGNIIIGTVLGLAVLVESYTSENLCPGGLVKCPEYMTCCQLANKEYGCCPFSQAVCCPDHVHCCPQNMQCDVAHQTCVKDGFPFKFFWQVPVQPELLEEVNTPSNTLGHQTEISEPEQLEETLKETKCPDEHNCPGDFTCCKMYNGKYGCCPFDGATCCPDTFHCCPKNFNCNPKTGGCYNKVMNFSMNAYRLKPKSSKMTSRKVKTNQVQNDLTVPGGKCPDGHPCPSIMSCCKMLGKSFGCCPYADAVCCTDLMHCCPHGTTCNTTIGTCDVQKNLKWSVPAQSLQAHMLSEVPEFKISSETKLDSEVGIVCPNRQYHCNDGETCCPVGGGAYGCCPMPLATCCPDRVHCCPHGYDCVNGGCRRRADSPNNLELLLNQFSAPIKIKEVESLALAMPSGEISNVVCPDRQSQCPDGNTCCEIASGGFGCCPMVQATCCGDMETCCPYGYWCTEGGCERVPGVASNLLPFLNKTPLSPSF